jgi:hypothetical protein
MLYLFVVIYTFVMLAKLSMRLSPSRRHFDSEGPTSKRLPNWFEKDGLLLKILKGPLNCPPKGQIVFLGAKLCTSSSCILKILSFLCSSKTLSNFPFEVYMFGFQTSRKLRNKINKPEN